MIEKENRQNGTAGYWIGFIAKIVLAVAMLVYLGLHSYNFFTWTFKGDQWIFAILGLFTTSIGFLLWLAIYLYVAEDGLEKAVSILMLFVSLFGEFAAAGFDMYMNISGKFNMENLTATDLRNMSYIIAGLALLNGLALVAGVAGQQILGDLASVKLPKRNKKPAEPVQTSYPGGKPELKIDNLTPEQFMDLAKYAARLNAENQVGQGSANGNGAVDPTQAAPR
jgi:hypothetical protein